MQPADYMIDFIDIKTGQKYDRIDSRRFRNLSYTKTLNATPVGECVITLPTKDSLSQSFQKHNLAEIYRRNSPGGILTKEATYLLTYYNPEEREGGESYTILKGQALEIMLDWREIRVEDDSTAKNGISTADGFGDAVMGHFVNFNCINPYLDIRRIIPGLSIAPTGNIGYYTVERRQDGPRVLEVIQGIAAKSKCDFRITRTTGLNWSFETGEFFNDQSKSANYPAGKYIMLSPERGNVRNPNLIVDTAKEVTAVLVYGSGPEESRVRVLALDNQALFESPLNWIERSISANENADDYDALNGAGQGEIQRAKNESYTFTFDIDLNNPHLRYNLDWQLGDKVTAGWGDFEKDLRISLVKVSVNSEENIEVEVSPANG